MPMESKSLGKTSVSKQLSVCSSSHHMLQTFFFYFPHYNFLSALGYFYNQNDPCLNLWLCSCSCEFKVKCFSWCLTLLQRVALCLRPCGSILRLLWCDKKHGVCWSLENDAGKNRADMPVKQRGYSCASSSVRLFLATAVL